MELATHSEIFRTRALPSPHDPRFCEGMKMGVDGMPWAWDAGPANAVSKPLLNNASKSIARVVMNFFLSSGSLQVQILLVRKIRGSYSQIARHRQCVMRTGHGRFRVLALAKV
jgi:hypothetical protein